MTSRSAESGCFKVDDYCLPFDGRAQNESLVSVFEERVTAILFGLYAVSTLTAMAPMSIGAGLLAVWLMTRRFTWVALAAYWKDPSFRSLKSYALASVLLALALPLSLLASELFPLYVPAWETGMTVYLTAERTDYAQIAKVWYFFFPILILPGWVALSSSSRMQVLRAWIMAFGLLSMLGIFQFRFGLFRAPEVPQLPKYHHVVLFLGHHLSLASVWIFPWFVSLDFLTKRDGPRRLGLPRWLLTFFVAMGLACLILSFSKAVWGTLPVGVLCWAVFRFRKKGLLILLASCFLGGAVILSQAKIREKISKRFGDDQGMADRRVLWNANLEFLQRRPILGVGFRKNIELGGYAMRFERDYGEVFAGHAHNNWIDALGGMGIAGFLGMLGWVFSSAGVVYRHRKRLLFSGGLLAAWVVFHLNGMIQVNFWEGKVQHQMMWMVLLALLPAVPSVRRQREI